VGGRLAATSAAAAFFLKVEIAAVCQGLSAKTAEPIEMPFWL